MSLTLQQPRQALNTAFRKVKPHRQAIERFKAHLTAMLDRTKAGESEEFHKNLVIDFLKKTYYDPHYYINTKGRTDLVIHTGDKAQSPVGVIIETKRPANKSGMVQKDNLNVKAFHELLLYYLRERITHKNLSIKHLIATNLREWFIFDANVFEKLFAQNNKLVQQFEDFEAGALSGTTTDFFYNEIAAPFIEALDAEIPCTCFDIEQYKDALSVAGGLQTEGAEIATQKLIHLYKLLSPEHLLKLPFANDSNSLNERFYGELLHLIGLTETKKGGKKLIERQPKGQRHGGTLMENAIIQVDSMDKLHQLQHRNRFGTTRDEQRFHVALQLCITWVNRILFLKLLEAQLLTYHKGEAVYKFLTIGRVRTYADLDALFFQVLARRPADRHEGVRDAFKAVPYLNSSLFEPTGLEHATVTISNLDELKAIPIYKHTVLKNPKGKRRSGMLNTLEYLFAFLDAYDFSSEGSEQIQEDNKTLINASVLGLIFEKINGYKDGSFFTPGFITMYMCRETIRRAVVQKFNEAKGWDCKDLRGVYNRIEDRREANTIINSLKVCDPAVGSGHFLVSALNELIAVKADLNILTDRAGRRLKEYRVEVVNDELVVKDEDDALFAYRPGHPESQRVQETLFHEKQTLIESSLFGVDINPNSVKICRLRLWIELLKHAYYHDNGELETLPNIDINIKCGNSLISRFDLKAGLGKALKQSKWTIDSYRTAVQTYRNARNREEKREMQRLIADIKSDFRTEISKQDPKIKRRNKLIGEVQNLTDRKLLFDETPQQKKVRRAKLDKVEARLEKLEKEIETIENNKIYEDAFEWRFEFPEVLDDDGNFTGFDVVIGNPPYIRQEQFSHLKPFLQAHYTVYKGTADLYTYFVERGLRILRDKGQFVFIIPNKWMRAGYGKSLRDFVKSYAIRQILDFGDLPVFEEATTYPCIIHLQKSKPVRAFTAANIETLDFDNGLAAHLKEQKIEVLVNELPDQGWTLIDAKVQKLLAKLRKSGTPLGEYVDGKIYRGVLTGLNEAFVIDRKTRDRLIAEDPKSKHVIKPFLAGKDIKRYQTPKVNNYLILFPKGFTIKRNLPPDDPNYLAEVSEPPPRYGDMPYDEAWEWIQSNFPAIAKHLTPFREKAKARYDKGDFWWELRACGYYEEFEKKKIMLPDISLRAQATMDDTKAFCVNTAYIIPTADKYLLALLNSKLIQFFYSNLTSSIRGGYLRFIRQYLKQIPVCEPKGKKADEIRSKADKILKLRGKDPKYDITQLDKEIDHLIYKHYGLTEEEIGVVENKVP